MGHNVSPYQTQLPTKHMHGTHKGLFMFTISKLLLLHVTQIITSTVFCNFISIYQISLATSVIVAYDR